MIRCRLVAARLAPAALAVLAAAVPRRAAAQAAPGAPPAAAPDSVPNPVPDPAPRPGARPADSTRAARLTTVTVRAATSRRAVTADEATLGVLGTRGLTETPFSVTVLGAGLLRAQQAASLGDYVKNDPSTVVSNVPVGFITLRGFNAGNAGFLYDGLPGHLGLTDGRGAVESVERVEVLKGPTAFLYGAGTSSSVGGTLNYVPKRATGAALRELDVSYAGRSLLGAAVDLGGRAGAGRRFGYRVNAAYKDGEQATAGYDWRHAVGAAHLDWQASRRLALAGSYEYARNELPRLQPFFALAPGVPVPRAPRATRNIAQPWDDFRTRTSTGYLRADYALGGGWTATAKALHNVAGRPGVLNARFGVIGDTLGGVTLFGDQFRYATRSTAAQAGVQGRVRGFGLAHDLSAGVLATRELARGSASDSSLGAFPTNLYAPAASPRPAALPLVHGPSSRAAAGGAYASDFVTFGGGWSALAGVRRSAVGTRNYDVRTGAELPGGGTLWATTPTAALMYAPAARALVYANYAEGLEPGGVAPQGTANQNARMPGLRTRQVELGAKYGPRGGAGGATVSAAVFDLRRPQEFVDGATNAYVQRGRQRHRGAELSVAGDVTPALSVVAGGMLLDPRAEGGDPATNGRRPVGVSRVTASAWARYRPRALGVSAGVFHTGAQYLDPANTQRVPAATRVDVGAEYTLRVGGRAVDYLLAVENVADRDYWTGGLSGLLVLSSPRTVKLTSRVRF